jgi:hypothetical protein
MQMMMMPFQLLVVDVGCGAASVDYLPDSGGGPWSLIIFFFRFPCLYPMKYLHPRSMYTLPRGGVQRGGTPSAGSRGAIPLAGGFGEKWAPDGVQGKRPLMGVRG